MTALHKNSKSCSSSLLALTAAVSSHKNGHKIPRILLGTFNYVNFPLFNTLLILDIFTPLQCSGISFFYNYRVSIQNSIKSTLDILIKTLLGSPMEDNISSGKSKEFCKNPGSSKNLQDNLKRLKISEKP